GHRHHFAPHQRGLAEKLECEVHPRAVSRHGTGHSPYKSLDDIIQAAKKEPGRLSFATPGTGTISHLISEAWQKSSNVKFTHVPFRGMAQA
ncbi:tripartite tricarboxylate transporter substrate-binding protein, partial [Escherichia coli]|uniref:tripartite tricarboxylate transporter substrate-binding protein n=1 Tax=Escherichia coli TaxID=562 RepID=UPI00207B429D